MTRILTQCGPTSRLETNIGDQATTKGEGDCDHSCIICVSPRKPKRGLHNYYFFFGLIHIFPSPFLSILRQTCLCRTTRSKSSNLKTTHTSEICGAMSAPRLVRDTSFGEKSSKLLVESTTWRTYIDSELCSLLTTTVNCMLHFQRTITAKRFQTYIN